MEILNKTLQLYKQYKQGNTLFARVYDARLSLLSEKDNPYPQRETPHYLPIDLFLSGRNKVFKKWALLMGFEDTTVLNGHLEVTLRHVDGGYQVIVNGNVYPCGTLTAARKEYRRVIKTLRNDMGV